MNDGAQSETVIERPEPGVGDEISYRSMGGCTVATVEKIHDGAYELDNGVTVPQHCVLEVLEQ